jgi:hypothetical membrane protein
MAGRLPVAPLAIAGIIAPLWFVTLVIVQGILQPDYSHSAMPISALAAWPAGWMQCVNFFVFATLMAAFAIGLHHVVLPTHLGLAGIVLLLASSVGMLMAGLFPWINVNGVPTETRPHVVGAILSFSCASTGLMVLSRRMAADPQWRGLSTYVLETGVVMLMLFIVLGAFAIEDGAPLHGWAGLLQRMVLVVWFPCILVMARKTLRLARERRWSSAAASR